MPVPAVERSIRQLITNIDRAEIPAPLIRQYLPLAFAALAENPSVPTADQLILEQIGQTIDDYLAAIIP